MLPVNCFQDAHGRFYDEHDNELPGSVARWASMAWTATGRSTTRWVALWACTSLLISADGLGTGSRGHRQGQALACWASSEILGYRHYGSLHSHRPIRVGRLGRPDRSRLGRLD